VFHAEPQEDYEVLSEGDIGSSEEDDGDAIDRELDADDDVFSEELHGVMHEPQATVLHQRVVELLETYSLASSGYLDWERDEEDNLLGWAQAQHKRLTDTCPNSQLVIDYCYDRMKSWRYNVKSRKVADEELHNNAYRQFPDLGSPDPSGFRNCWPPTMECAEAVLRKPALDRYLIDCCPNGCEHFWPFMPQFRQHYKDCGGCELCKCPHCDGDRFVKDKHGLRGRARCWLFHDAFQQMFLDPDLACALLKGRAARNDENQPAEDPMKPSFSRYREGKRLSQELPQQGYSMDKVSQVMSFKRIEYVTLLTTVVFLTRLHACR
jgi:hypothetical protein